MAAGPGSMDVLESAKSTLRTHDDLMSHARQTQVNLRRQLRPQSSPQAELLKLPAIPPRPSVSPSPPASLRSESQAKPPRPDLSVSKRARVARYHNYIPEEETIRNDYSQRYVDGGEWPQDWVLGAEPERRFEEYPKQQRLLNLKKESVNNHSVTPSYIPFARLPSLHPCKFDVILLDPPFSSSFSWGELQELPIPALAADPSFVFMWVGSGAGEGLERGREILAKWGYRRCEDVVWVKTNHTTNRGPGTDPPTTSLLTRTKQHCLMGIKGTVRRSTDSWFVHCNVDTDVIIWEGDSADPTRKPPEMYTLIENFCLGTRRLEIFGRARSSLRRGWVSALLDGEENHIPELSRVPMSEDGVGIPEGTRPWDKEWWEDGTKELGGGKCVVPNSAEIDALRPKSPVRGGNANTQSQQQMQNNPPRMAPQAPQFQQNQMMMQPMMNMGGAMNPLVGMGNMAVGMDGGMGMGNWPMAMGMNMANPMAMGGSMPPMNNMGMNMMDMGMDGGMGGGNFYPQGQMGRVPGMWIGADGGDGGVWDGRMNEEMFMGGAGMQGMGGMNMGMGPQWNQGGYEGFQQ